MATVYKVEMEIVSEYCSYSKEWMRQKITELIKDFRDKDTKLGLLVRDLNVKIKA